MSKNFSLIQVEKNKKQVKMEKRTIIIFAKRIIFCFFMTYFIGFMNF